MYMLTSHTQLYVPLQVSPSDCRACPRGHSQMKLPTVLEQSCWHPPLLVAHSSMSVEVLMRNCVIQVVYFLRYNIHDHLYVGQLYLTKIMIRSRYTTKRE